MDWLLAVGPFAILLAFLGLYLQARLRKHRILLHPNSLEIEDGELKCRLAFEDIEYVDVSTGNRDGGAGFVVFVKTAGGNTHVLSEALGRTGAVALCRAIESAMISAQHLKPANRPRVRIETQTQLAEEPLTQAAEQRQDAK